MESKDLSTVVAIAKKFSGSGGGGSGPNIPTPVPYEDANKYLGVNNEGEYTLYSKFVDVSYTLRAGMTQVSLQDLYLTNNSQIMVFTGKYGVNPTDVIYFSDDHNLIVTFEEQQTDLGVTLRIYH